MDDYFPADEVAMKVTCLAVLFLALVCINSVCFQCELPNAGLLFSTMQALRVSTGSTVPEYCGWWASFLEKGPENAPHL